MQPVPLSEELTEEETREIEGIVRSFTAAFGFTPAEIQKAGFSSKAWAAMHWVPGHTVRFFGALLRSMAEPDGIRLTSGEEKILLMTVRRILIEPKYEGFFDMVYNEAQEVLSDLDDEVNLQNEALKFWNKTEWGIDRDKSHILSSIGRVSAVIDMMAVRGYWSNSKKWSMLDGMLIGPSGKPIAASQFSKALTSFKANPEDQEFQIWLDGMPPASEEPAPEQKPQTPKRARGAPRP